VADVDVPVDAADLEMTEAEAERAEADPVVLRNLAILREWACREPRGAARRIHVRFWSRPVEVLGRHRAEHLRLERTSIDATGRLVGTGAGADIAAQLLVRSVGYRSAPLEGVPFDEESSTVPNQAGRVHIGPDPVPGQYVVGWLKRGPSGIIGTNKVDALQTAASVLDDAPALLQGPLPPLDLTEVLVDRGLTTTDMGAWHLIDAAEISLGASRGRPRTTLHDRHDLMTAARRL
jgi:NADPH-dependent glutamate synthase beta subunit-like oxidoreductase